jgi:hypothetical protein
MMSIHPIEYLQLEFQPHLRFQQILTFSSTCHTYMLDAKDGHPFSLNGKVFPNNDHL